MESMLENVDSKPTTPSTASTVIFYGIAHSKSVKRPRPVKSCIECRKRKLRCDRIRVGACSQCQKSRRTCRYADQDNGAGSDTSDVDASERPVKRSQPLIALRDGAQTDGIEQGLKGLAGLDDIVARLERLETAVFEKDSPAHHHHHHHAPPSPMALRGRPVKGRLLSRDYGKPRIQTLLSLFDEAHEVLAVMAKTDLLRSLRSAYHALRNEHQKALEPITVFVDSMMPIQTRMADILPPRPVCDRLLDQYFVVSEGLYRMVHIPSFQQEYARYLDGKGCNDSFLPRLLCMLCIAAGSGTDSRGLGHDRSTTVHIPTACVLVRHYLDNLRRRHVVDLTALQTELLLLQALKTVHPKEQSSWTQLGYIVRMAMTMGLHHDPSETPSLTPFTGECRRRLWFTVLEMDLDASLTRNLPCAIRPGEHSCRAPHNLDDTALLPTTAAPLPDSQPLDHPTTNHLQAYAARTLPVRMQAAALLSRLDSRTHTPPSYDEVLAVGTKLEAMLHDVNALFPLRHGERRRGALLDMHVRRTLLALYRPFFALGSSKSDDNNSSSSSNYVPPPEQLTLSYLRSCMAVLGHVEDRQGRGEEAVVVVVAGEVVEAGLGVCWFISKQPVPGGGNTDAAAGWGDDEGAERFCPWSVAAMVQAVERALDWLVGVVLQQDAGGHAYLRDIVALGVVLEAVQQHGSVEQKVVKGEARMRRILEVCRQNVKVPTSSNQTSHSRALLNGRLNPDGYVDGRVPDEMPTERFTWEDFLCYWDPPAALTDAS